MEKNCSVYLSTGPLVPSPSWASQATGPEPACLLPVAFLRDLGLRPPHPGCPDLAAAPRLAVGRGSPGEVLLRPGFEPRHAVNLALPFAQHGCDQRRW